MTSPRVAIVGATPELAAELAALLVDRGFVADRLRLLGGENTAGEVVEVAGRRLRIGAALSDSLADVEIAVFCGDPRLAARLIPQAHAAGALSLDATGATRGLTSVPTVVPEVNGELLEGLEPGAVVCSPDPFAVALALVLAPLHRLGGVRRVVATVLEPASRRGADGVEELSRQTITLMQGRPLDRVEFPEQFAFNLRVETGEAATGWSDVEEALGRVVPALLAAPETVVAATIVHAPVFFGTAMALDVELEAEVGAEQVVLALREGQGLLVAGSPEDAIARAIRARAARDLGTVDEDRAEVGDDGEEDDVDGDRERDEEEDPSELDFDRQDDADDRDEDGDGDDGDGRATWRADRGGHGGDGDGARFRGAGRGDGEGDGSDGDGRDGDSLEAADPGPGPVEVAGSDFVHVSRVRVDPRRPTAIALWIAYDELRRGVARNLVSILETVLAPDA